ncbi:MAG: NUDIX domain-containing protein [Acidimicrobiia bacterium]|nr:NUDIX domain-containing protein [Acidimicrobiia bacterium]
MSASPTETISASGGVVVRFVSGGSEVLIVHRPSYDDWSFPKGKEDPGEIPPETAVREVEEETGLRTRIVGELGSTEYEVSRGNKKVHWFVMRPVAGGTRFSPNDEVDQTRWVSPEGAGHLLTYNADRELLKRTPLEAHRRNGTLYVVRHAHAIKRKDWNGEDHLRPLTPKGVSESIGIANLLETAQVERIVSSPALRCVQSVEPLAERTGVAIEANQALAENVRPETTATLVKELAGSNAVVCTHGDLMPLIVEDLVVGDHTVDGTSSWPKGSTWTITVDAGRLVSSSYLGPPKGSGPGVP